MAPDASVADANDPVVPVATPAGSPAATAFSPDGAWFWDGAQWRPVAPQHQLAAAALAVAAPIESAPPAVAASGPRRRPSGRGWLQSLVLLAALVVSELVWRQVSPQPFNLAMLGAAAVGMVVIWWNPLGAGRLVAWFAIMGTGGLLAYWYLSWTALFWLAGVGAFAVALAWWNPGQVGSTVTRVAAAIRLPFVHTGTANRSAAMVLALDLVLIPAGVGGWSAYSWLTSSYAVQIDGYATLANPVTEATVNVYQLTGNGKAGAFVGSTTTDKTGFYEFFANQPPGTELLVETKGGSYVDEVTKKPVTVAAGDSLQSILRPGEWLAFLTPLSTFATARAMALAASGHPLGDSIQAAFTGIAQDYGLPDVRDTFPSIASVTPDKQTAISSLASRQLGLELAGLDAEASALGVSDFALSDALAADIADGDFDGKAGKLQIYIGKPVSPSIRLAFSSNPSPILPPGGGAGGMCQFVGSPDNQLKDIPCPPVFAGPVEVGVNAGGLSWISTADLPAWRSGETGSATIRGVGGTMPYSCALDSGSLPAGFTLSPNCQLSGTAPVLANTRITGGFIVRMTDSSRPARSMKTELHITIVPKPPVVRIAAGTCPAPNVPCNIAGFATATGGTPPYYFHKNIGGAFPPLGMQLWLDGSLRGKPKRAGISSEFSVCAVDIGGSIGCTNATFNTLNPPSPSPVQRGASPASKIAGTWVGGPIDFTRTVGGCSVETDHYTSSTWVITKTADDKVAIHIALGGGVIASQSNPGCLNFIVYLNNPISIGTGTVTATSMALADSDIPPNPQGNCTIAVSSMTCTIDDGQHGGFDYATAPNAVNLTRQK